MLEIVDTVYLVAYLRPSDPLHGEAVRVIEGLGHRRRLSQASLVELDLLMKSRGFECVERLKTWALLEKVIPIDAVEPLRPLDFAAALILVEEHGLDYFDALVAAQCITRRARTVTTDKEIQEAVSEDTASAVLSKLGTISSL